MTHSLHRLGNETNLEGDYVILVTPSRGINHEDSKNKLRAILDKIFELGPNNLGSYETGTFYSGATIDEIKKQLSEVPRVRCCFDNREKVIELLQYIKEQEFGLSVTVSGLITEVLEITDELKIKPHSVNLSLGIHGETEKLPTREVLEIITMCGHGMISANIVHKYNEDLNNGRLTAKEAAEKISIPCVCGIFNTKRTKKLLEKLSGRL